MVAHDVFYQRASGMHTTAVYQYCNVNTFDPAGLRIFPRTIKAETTCWGISTATARRDIFKFGDGAPGVLWISTGGHFSKVRTDLPTLAKDYMPVAGDFNGDGRTDIASFRRGRWAAASRYSSRPRRCMETMTAWISFLCSTRRRYSGDNRGAIAGDWNSDGANGSLDPRTPTRTSSSC